MMRRALEAVTFLGLASALHAGAWLGFGPGGAPSPEPGAGTGGTAPLTLAAAGPAVAALVERWQTPPAAATADPAPLRQALAPAAPRSLAGRPATDPEVPHPGASPGAPAAPALPDAVPDRVPDAEMAETAPAVEPLRPRPRPEPRPDRTARAAPAARAQPEGPAAGADDAPAAAPRAEGAGDRRAAGERGEGAARAATAGTLRALEREWGAAILARIARRQQYPPGDHGSGTARVTLTVGRDGRLRGVALAASSGSAALDRAALEAVRRAGRFPPAPPGLDRPAYVFAVPMTFRRN